MNGWGGEEWTSAHAEGFVRASVGPPLQRSFYRLCQRREAMDEFVLAVLGGGGSLDNCLCL